MKVLFVCSGNSKDGISSIVKSQGDSLEKAGIDIEYFTIKGKGIKGYFQNIFSLRKFLRRNKYDVIHAHYSLSAYCATLAGAKKLVVSLMGSDVHQSVMMASVIRLCSRFLWAASIVKSQEMKEKLSLKAAFVLPNGVDFDKFLPIEKQKAQEIVGFESSKKNIIFVANPARHEKNFALAEASVDQLEDDSVCLHSVYNLPHNEIVNYMYAADVLLLTSLWEGSPNVIKEALTCNCPLVTVPVGDVKKLVQGVSGTYICTYESADVALKLKLALGYGKRTEGREKIIDLGLDSVTVACKIIEIYKSI